MRLGFIRKRDRTNAQIDQHAANEAGMARFALAPPIGLGPLKVYLWQAWSNPKVVKEVGLLFQRFHQLTGSCVGAGGGQALFCLIALQRLLAVAPTLAFLPFWLFDYGRCRSNEGDRGQGEGAMGSSFASTVVKEGVLDARTAGLPAFTDGGDEGITYTERIEMQYSDGNSSLNTQLLPTARVHPLGAAAPLRDVGSIKASVTNGFPVTFACDRFIGNGSIQGSGDEARVMGHWDHNGGHQQSIHGYEDHPTFGPIYLALNNWPKDTYPILPTQPVCSTWVTEAYVERALGYDAEVYGFSHLNYFPAQPDVPAVLDWSAL